MHFLILVRGNNLNEHSICRLVVNVNWSWKCQMYGHEESFSWLLNGPKKCQCLKYFFTKYILHFTSLSFCLLPIYNNQSFPYVHCDTLHGLIQFAQCECFIQLKKETYFYIISWMDGPPYELIGKKFNYIYISITVIMDSSYILVGEIPNVFLTFLTVLSALIGSRLCDSGYGLSRLCSELWLVPVSLFWVLFSALYTTKTTSRESLFVCITNRPHWSKHWKRNYHRVSSFSLLSYLFDKSCSYLKMMFIYGFVHLALTCFIFGSCSRISLAPSASLTVIIVVTVSKHRKI